MSKRVIPSAFAMIKSVSFRLKANDSLREKPAKEKEQSAFQLNTYKAFMFDAYQLFRIEYEICGIATAADRTPARSGSVFSALPKAVHGNS